MPRNKKRDTTHVRLQGECKCGRDRGTVIVLIRGGLSGCARRGRAVRSSRAGQTGQKSAEVVVLTGIGQRCWSVGKG
jgi:hypothetical protein